MELMSLTVLDVIKAVTTCHKRIHRDAESRESGESTFPSTTRWAEPLDFAVTAFSS